jgi:hypothetical protein
LSALPRKHRSPGWARSVAFGRTPVIQAPELGARIMRYELADYEWLAIKPITKRYNGTLSVTVDSRNETEVTMELLKQAAMTCPKILRQPPTTVTATDIKGDRVTYDIKCRSINPNFRPFKSAGEGWIGCKNGTTPFSGRREAFDSGRKKRCDPLRFYGGYSGHTPGNRRKKSWRYTKWVLVTRLVRSRF